MSHQRWQRSIYFTLPTGCHHNPNSIGDQDSQILLCETVYRLHVMTQEQWRRSELPGVIVHNKASSRFTAVTVEIHCSE